jgi:hypothetical protein
MVEQRSEGMMNKKRMNTQVREHSVTLTREQYDTVLYFLNDIRTQLRAKIDDGRTDLIGISNSAVIAAYWLTGEDPAPIQTAIDPADVEDGYADAVGL